MADQQHSAETLALQALAWIMEQDDVAGHYLSASGADARSLMACADDPDVLAGVLDFLLSQDAWVVGFAEGAGVRPEAVVRARRALPGGETIDWA